MKGVEYNFVMDKLLYVKHIIVLNIKEHTDSNVTLHHRWEAFYTTLQNWKFGTRLAQ